MKKSAVIIILSFLCLVVLSYAEDGISSKQNENLERRIQQKEGEKAHDLSTILVKFKEKIALNIMTLKFDFLSKTQKRGPINLQKAIWHSS